MERDDKDSNLEQQIDENLRKVYQKTLQEEVPDRLVSLLRQLRDQDGQDGR